MSSLSIKYDINKAKNRYLVRLIDKHGEDILRKNRNRYYSSELKLEIINKVLIDKQSILSTAIEHGLSSSGISDNWLKSYKENGYNIVEKSRGRPSSMKKEIKPISQAFNKYEDLKGLILHSDQGWQYQMQPYHQALKDKGIKQSMSRKGNCLDNSPMENFFGKMKNEMFYGYEYTFQTLEDLKIAMEEYIEYYNTQRITTKLKGLTPVQYRIQSLLVV